MARTRLLWRYLASSRESFSRVYPWRSGTANLRGGAWNNNPRNVRVSNRNRNEPTNRNNNIGFRCSGYAECGENRRPEPHSARRMRARSLRFRAVGPGAYRSGRAKQQARLGFLVAVGANVSPAFNMGRLKKFSPGGGFPLEPPLRLKTKKSQGNSPLQRKPTSL